MPEWAQFTDEEIALIKQKMNQRFDKVMIVLIIISPFILLVMPYIPSRRGRGAMIDKMPYWDAVLQGSIIWFIALIMVWIWNHFSSQRQFSRNRKFLKKRIVKTEIISKSVGIFYNPKNQIITELEGKLNKLDIKKKEFNDFNIGDRIRIEYEEHTKTILDLDRI